MPGPLRLRRQPGRSRWPSPRSGACSSASHACDYAATTWPSPRWASARSSASASRTRDRGGAGRQPRQGPARADDGHAQDEGQTSACSRSRSSPRAVRARDLGHPQLHQVRAGAQAARRRAGRDRGGPARDQPDALEGGRVRDRRRHRRPRPAASTPTTKGKITPLDFNFMEMVKMFLIIVLGGMGSLSGCVSRRVPRHRHGAVPGAERRVHQRVVAGRVPAHPRAADHLPASGAVRTARDHRRVARVARSEDAVTIFRRTRSRSGTAVSPRCRTCVSASNAASSSA